MARKPVHLTMGRGRLRGGRQAAWEAMRRLQRFTTADIASAGRMEITGARDYLTSLQRGGYIAIAEIVKGGGAARTYIYELVRDIGIEAPRLRKDGRPCVQGLAREQMWRTMKILTDFDYRDLAIAATTEDISVSEGNSRDYIHYLLTAGYLHLTAAGGPARPARYQFVRAMNTGPQPPMVQRTKVVFDPNLGRIVWQEEVAE